MFVGVGGSLSADHKSVVAGTVGISASGVSLRFASVKDGLDSFTDLELSVASASLVGIPGIDLFVSDLRLVQSTSTSVASLDFSALGLSLQRAADGDAHDRARRLVYGGPLDRGLRLRCGLGARLEAVGDGSILSPARRRRCWSRSPARSLFVGVGGCR